MRTNSFSNEYLNYSPAKAGGFRDD